MKTQRSMKDPWKKNAYADKKRHAGIRRERIDAERAQELDKHLTNWKKNHVELDKEYTLDY